MRGASLTILLSVVACSDREIRLSYVDPEIDLGVLLLADEIGRPTRTIGIFQGGRDAFEVTAAPEAGEGSVILVAIREEDLVTIEPRYTGIEALELARPPTSKERDREPPRARFALPEGTRYLGASLDDTNPELTERSASETIVDEETTLLVAIDLEHCGPEREITTLSNEFPEHGAILRLDERRVITAYRSKLYLYDVQGTRLDELEPSLDLFSPDQLWIRDLSRDQSSAVGKELIWASGCDGWAEGCERADARGVVLRIEIEGDTIAAATTATITARSLRAVASVEDLTLTVGRDGFTLEIDRSGAMHLAAPMPLRSSTGEAEIWPERLTEVSDPRRPFLASSRDFLHRFDPIAHAWETEEPPHDFAGESYYGIAGVLDETSGEADLWAVGLRKAVRRKIGDRAWERVVFDYPPSFAPCVADGDINYVRVHGDSVVLSFEFCTALLEVRRSDLCTNSVIEPGRTPRFEEPSTHLLNVVDDRLTYFVEPGFLKEVRLD